MIGDIIIGIIQITDIVHGDIILMTHIIMEVIIITTIMVITTLVIMGGMAMLMEITIKIQDIIIGMGEEPIFTIVLTEEV
jgi:hypothetical protein